MKRSIVILHRDLCEEWIDILKKGNYNTLGLHFITAENKLEEYLEWLEQKGRTLIQRIEAEGILVEHELHALANLLPRDHFAAHPEYFRLSASGERTPDVNLCCASQEALTIVEENAYRLAAALKQSGHRYYLWSDDKADAWCHCPACQAVSPSDQNLRILQHMLAGLRQYDPQAELCNLSYLGTIDPPTEPIPNGIFLEYAPIKRDLTRPITDDVNRPHREALERLLTVFPTERAEILEYWLDVSLHTKYGKLPLARVPYLESVLQADLDYYASLGVCAVKTFGAYMNRDYLERFGAQEIIAYGNLLQQTEQKKQHASAQ